MSNSDNMKPKGHRPGAQAFGSFANFHLLAQALLHIRFCSPDLHGLHFKHKYRPVWPRCHRPRWLMEVLRSITIYFFCDNYWHKWSNPDYPQEVKERAMCECTREPFHYYKGGLSANPWQKHTIMRRKKIKTLHGRLLVRTDHKLFIP